MSCEINYRNLHSQADSKVRNILFPAELCRENFSFDSAVSEAARNKNAVDIAKDLVCIVRFRYWGHGKRGAQDVFLQPSGILSFAAPFALTYFTSAYCLGYRPMSALLLSCIMSACTLIAYPIVGRYGLQRHRTVTLSVGASMLSLLLSLITLAAISGAFYGNGTSISFWILFILKFSAYCLVMAFLIRRLTRWFLHRYSDAVMQFIFVLSLFFLSAALSSLIGLEGIFLSYLL